MPNLPLNIPRDVDKYFYNRKKDIVRINSLLDALNYDVSQQILITGYRGVGKTFLLKKVLKEQPDDFKTIYLDISKIYSNNNGNLTSEKILKELLQSMLEEIDDILNEPKIREIFNKISLNDYDFKDAASILKIPIPKISTNYEKLAKFVMDFPQKIVDSYEDIKGFVIVIDEFQLLKELERPEAFFWLIRSYTQYQDNVDYVFTGSTSNNSKITQMINGYDGAFAGRMVQINIEPFTKEEVKSYFKDRMPEIEFSEDGFERFYTCTRGIPAYINSFANVLSKYEVYDEYAIKETFFMKMDQILVIWIEIWGTLNESERKILSILVENDNLSWSELAEKSSFSKTTLSKYLDILNNKGLIRYSNNKTYAIEDEMLLTWLKYRKETIGFLPL